MSKTTEFIAVKRLNELTVAVSCVIWNVLLCVVLEGGCPSVEILLHGR